VNFVANYYVGSFTLTASGGAVSGYTIIAPPAVPSYGTPSASPSIDVRMQSGQVDTINVYAPGYQPEIFTVQPYGNQPAIYITVTPAYIIP
jgi:hypothetical protein